MARTGQRRNRVTWNQRTGFTNVNSQAVPAYTPVGDYWARVVPLAGREAIIAQQLRADVTHMIEMLNVGNIKPADQLIWNGRTLEVTSCTPKDEIGIELKIIAVEVVQ